MRIFILLMLVFKSLFALYDGDYKAYKEGCLYGYSNKLENLPMYLIRGMNQDDGFDYNVFDRLCVQVGKTGKYISQIEFEKQVYGKYVHMRKPLVKCEDVQHNEKKLSLAKTRNGVAEVKKCADYGEYIVFNGKAITPKQECQSYNLLQTYQTSKGDAVLLNVHSGGITPYSFRMLWVPIAGKPTLIDIELSCHFVCEKPRTKQIGDVLELSCERDMVIFQNGRFSK